MSAAAKKEQPAIVAYFDPKKPHGTVAGDSVARYYQGKRHFDAEGFVVHEHHSTRPMLEIIDAHEAHKEQQREARAEAQKRLEAASKSLDKMVQGDAEVPAVEKPESGWDKDSVSKKFQHREADVRKLAALSNARINAVCKDSDLPYNEAVGAAAKWENIHTLLEATEPEADGDQAGESGAGGDGQG